MFRKKFYKGIALLISMHHYELAEQQLLGSLCPSEDSIFSLQYLRILYRASGAVEDELRYEQRLRPCLLAETEEAVALGAHLLEQGVFV